MSSKAFDLTKLDLYGIIGIEEDATEKQIVKAYRKQALKCHPDKNPDNPEAADRFHKLAKALEVLTDAAARAAYDKILKAKKAAQLRHKQLDAKRKKFKDDLEARESVAQSQKEKDQAAARNLQTEIERLRKEGSKLVEREQELLKEELERNQSRLAAHDDDSSEEEEQTTVKLKVKWKLKNENNRLPSYTQEELQGIFGKYGEVLNVVVSVKKTGTAIVELASPFAADSAVKTETGKSDNPFIVTWLQGQPPQKLDVTNTADDIATNPSRTTSSQFASPPVSSANTGSHDFESLVLMRMRQAEERKRLIQQMQEEDGDT